MANKTTFFDPFDHDDCDHPAVVWPLELTPSFSVDLLKFLRVLWLANWMGKQDLVKALLLRINHDLTLSALGEIEELEASYKRVADMHEMVEYTADSIDTLNEDSKFDSALADLLGVPPAPEVKPVDDTSLDLITFKTENSIYQLDVLNQRVRRLGGLDSPTENFGKDGEWRDYHEIDKPTVGERCLIVWTAGPLSKTSCTLTSTVKQVKK